MVEFDKSVLGKESPPVTYDVEKGAIRKFAEAIGDPNPIYYDEEAARKAGLDGIIAPPTFLCTFLTKDLPDLKMEFGKYRLNGGNEYEYFKPIKAGDRITVTAKYVDVSEKSGRSSGTMVFIITEVTYRNQHGEVVAKARNTGIRRGA
jgi:acyl dehydratase